MKRFITTIFILAAFSLPQISFADTCSLTKTLYEAGEYKRAYNLAKTHANNDACAEFYLGLMYLNGDGVKANTEKGHSLIESAAKKGYQPAIDYFNNRQP